MRAMNEIVLGSSYTVLVNYTKSHIDGGFLCAPIAETGIASLPFVDVLFICDYTSKKIVQIFNYQI